MAQFDTDRYIALYNYLLAERYRPSTASRLARETAQREWAANRPLG